MTLRAIDYQAVLALIQSLMQEAKVVAPHQREGERQWSFEEVTEPANVCLEYTSTVLPPKKYAFPTQERFLRYELGESPKAEPIIEAEPLVLFGVHTCDIYALNCLDIAMTDEHVDPNWVARRKQMRIVGVDCLPDEYCFCASMGTATVHEGYDLFLTPVDGGYVVEVATGAGEEMLTNIPTKEATSAQVAQVKAHLKKKMQQEHKLDCDVSTLPLHFSGVADSELWKQHAERCYSCGTCNLVCPTCICYDVLEQLNLALDGGERVRVWDSCMLEEFATVATGENFREERSQRLRHRFFRKYSYLFTRYGQPYCCGCGRCVRQCLVHIDPVPILNDVIAESQKGATVRGA